MEILLFLGFQLDKAQEIDYCLANRISFMTVESFRSNS